MVCGLGWQFMTGTFADVVYIYGIIIVEFLFEYTVFAALFLHKLRRRDKFALRVALGLLIVFAVGLPVAWFYVYFGSTLWWRMFVYLFLFAVYSLVIMLCGFLYIAEVRENALFVGA